ncbi:MAG: TATA element modulatory factor 1 TATA binding protein [Olpidium bornovanus]|uniref:TATA element modulatory factor 1 TATA binding protein n=1 Tax=Olpidium bornovanus TaxID=278681 RepID=A0A8H8DL10_9FUNG|nr:MAG: TATA element modulatory factor 1 TATA binding protein [Olpidium bornovanus]
MVRMTTEVERLKEQAAAIPQLEAAHAELQVRHDAALELLGEKTEQASELQADIADLKEAYRSQITDLIEQVNRLTRQQQQQQR